MRISLIQDNIVWANKGANLEIIGNELALLAGHTDLVVLPEMFTTGFCTDNLQLGEAMNGETIKTIYDWAKKYQLAITGSFIASENGKTYNRAFFIFPSGEIQTADKRHLFTMGGEHTFFTAGDKRLIVNYCGFKIILLVCYDLRFPVWSRNVNNEYDLLIFVANFPKKRISDWDILLKARAIENQSYVCGVNRIGVDGLGISYNGHSTLLDFKAQALLNFPDNQKSVQTYTLEQESLKHYRQKFSVWKDGDNFTINLS